MSETSPSLDLSAMSDDVGAAADLDATTSPSGPQSPDAGPVVPHARPATPRVAPSSSSRVPGGDETGIAADPTMMDIGRGGLPFSDDFDLLSGGMAAAGGDVASPAEEEALAAINDLEPERPRLATRDSMGGGAMAELPLLLDGLELGDQEGGQGAPQPGSAADGGAGGGAGASGSGGILHPPPVEPPAVYSRDGGGAPDGSSEDEGAAEAAAEAGAEGAGGGGDGGDGGSPATSPSKRQGWRARAAQKASRIRAKAEDAMRQANNSLASYDLGSKVSAAAASARELADQAGAAFSEMTQGEGGSGGGGQAGGRGVSACLGRDDVMVAELMGQPDFLSELRKPNRKLVKYLTVSQPGRPAPACVVSCGLHTGGGLDARAHGKKTVLIALHTVCHRDGLSGRGLSG